MKFNNKYKDLLEITESVYDNTIDTLNYHIKKLQIIIEEQNARIEKLTGGDKLAEEIAQITVDNNSVVTVDSCPGCDKVIDELRAENARLKEELRGAKISAGKLRKKTVKVKKVKHSKQSLCLCKDCGSYFYAKRSDAKRCPSCKKEYARNYKREWQNKRAAAKEM